MVENRGRGAWIGLFVVAAAAVVFLVLWILRGGELERATRQLREARDEAGRTASRLETEGRRTRDELDAARRRAEELEGRLRDEPRRTAQAVQAAERRVQASADAVTEELRAAQAELESLRSTAAQTTAAEQARADAERRLAEAVKREEDFRTRLAEAGRTIEELEARASEAGTALQTTRDELTAARNELDNSLSAAREAVDGELRTEAARLEAALAASENANAAGEELRNRLSQSLERERQRAREREAEFEAELERLRQAIAITTPSTEGPALDTDSSTWQARAEAAEAALREERSLTPVRRVLESLRSEGASEGSEEDLRAIADELRRMGYGTGSESESGGDGAQAPSATEETAAALFPKAKAVDMETAALPADAEGGGFYYVVDPELSCGSIVERLNDGQTLLIRGGSREGLRPGMRLLVHRPDGTKQRHVGMITVKQTMDHFATARPVAAPPAKYCPVTGRAVVEPGAECSPFARGAGDVPLPLLAAGEPGGDSEPEIGDSLHSPFFIPGRQAVFAVSETMARDGTVLALVGALGGTPCLGDAESAADFLVVPEEEAVPGDTARPRRVTPAYLRLFTAGSAGSTIRP